LIYWIARWRGHDLLEPQTRFHRWFLRGAVLAAPLAIAALELGWIATEVGRQPWIVYGIMRTTEAAGENSGLWWLYGTTVVVYTALSWGAISILRSMARRWRAGEEDLPSPYGPEPVEHAPELARDEC
ncbi:MAG: cytochrome ubiquinol oxidase subunit I, partial [Actinobacteria bacterium]|nr:cytochrome ubiquinol oxidase subunit I [Actinomycetota bacterium]